MGQLPIQEHKREVALCCIPVASPNLFPDLTRLH
ncbi:hypothetical protein D041_4096A, partial [Vibrio parahaemolyticus EKP-008]